MKPSSFAEGKHHSKKPNLSGRQIRLFVVYVLQKNASDIFAYEFERLQFLVKSFANAHGEIIYFVNCEI